MATRAQKMTDAFTGFAKGHHSHANGVKDATEMDAKESMATSLSTENVAHNAWAPMVL